MTKRIRNGCDYCPTSTPTPTKPDPLVPPSSEPNPNIPDLPTPDDATLIPRKWYHRRHASRYHHSMTLMSLRCRDGCREVVVSDKTRRPELCWSQCARGRPCADDCVGKCVAGRLVVWRSVEDHGGGVERKISAILELCDLCHVGKDVARVLRRGVWWWGYGV